MEVRQVAVAAELALREVLAAAGRGLAEVAVAGHRVEELVIDDRDHDVVQAGAQFHQLCAQSPAALGQVEDLGPFVLEGLDIEEQSVGIGLNAIEALVSAAFLAENGQLFLKFRMCFGDARGDEGEFLGCSGGREAWSGDHQGVAVLRDPEGGHQLGDAALVHAVLDVAHAVEREPAH